VIAGFNDSDNELTRLAEFLAGVSPDIPWHVTAFHKDYKMTDSEAERVRNIREVHLWPTEGAACGKGDSMEVLSFVGNDLRRHYRRRRCQVLPNKSARLHST
jgi:hypothetical protein